MSAKRVKPSRKRQPLLPGLRVPTREFGGSLLKNSHAKTKRPIACKRAMHVVLRSSRSRGALSLLSPKRAGRIQAILHIQAEKFRVKLKKIANGGSHIHLVVQAQTVEGFKGFLRAVTGAIAKFCRGLEAGSAKPSFNKMSAAMKTKTFEVDGPKGSDGRKEKFWDQRPFTKILEWGRMYRSALRYLTQNMLEAIGFIPYQDRLHAYVGHNGHGRYKGHSRHKIKIWPFETI